MMLKLPALGFALVTALTGTALAHEPHHTQGGPGYRPAGYGHSGHGNSGQGHSGHGHSGHGHSGHGPAGYGSSDRGGPYATRGGYAPTAAVDLRYADLNRDGWVTLEEALDSGRQVFHRVDRDNDRVLSRREVSHTELAQEDRNRDGRLSLREHQRAVRTQFASYDRNHDGYLARYELGLQGSRGSRSAGWWR
jgi:hypothetical protein